MKDLLIIGGVGFLVYHFMLSKTGPQSNPQVDGTGTTVMSSVAASVPLPGTATAGVTGATIAPAAGSAGMNPSLNPNAYNGPASLGSDLPLQSGMQGSGPDAVTHAFDRADYVNPHSPFSNSMLAR